MPLSKPVNTALKTWRTVFGEGTVIENWVKNRYLTSISTEVTKESGPGWVQYSGRRFIVVSESDDFPEPRRGILLKGGCDLPSVFTAGPLLRDGIKGTIAITRHIGGTGGNRSDQILQTLEDLDPAAIAETRKMLKMSEDYFEPTLFDPTFRIPRLPEAGEFPKNVVILSIASDETRQMYRHREHGFIADPGGWWLNQDMNRVLENQEVVEWFRTTFKRIGRMNVEDFRKSNSQLIREIRERLGGEVIYYNTMGLDPANPTHNYQLVKTAHSVRRREFIIALAELSQELGFPIVDVDRILKTAGVKEQVDFAHFPVDRMAPLGAEVFRILRQSELV
ncbi:MAG TPA: hypothetical protein VLG28_17710 [Acidimicrobiia bacterium]|jgi:hypothetical protein|nr:hypothetical protein [Acidimicrobiia bacterium]